MRKIEEIKLEHIRVVEWEGWCKRNTSNRIHSVQSGNGVVVFVSGNPISELEVLGLEKLTNDILKEYRGLDVHTIITPATYHKSSDQISVFNSSLPYIEKVTEHCVLEEQKELLLKSDKVICLYWFTVPRWEKSKLWRLLHKRYFKVDNWYSYL